MRTDQVVISAQTSFFRCCGCPRWFKPGTSRAPILSEWESGRVVRLPEGWVRGHEVGWAVVACSGDCLDEWIHETLEMARAEDA
jgi:hypothetical protein